VDEDEPCVVRLGRTELEELYRSKLSDAASDDSAWIENVYTAKIQKHAGLYLWFSVH
jgi:hypothetical protein